MSGKHSGLKTLFLQDNEKALYLHCYAHSLQLAVQDAVKASETEIVSDAIELCHETAKLIRNSPRRTANFNKLKEEIKESSVGVRQLCPTR